MKKLLTLLTLTTLLVSCEKNDLSGVEKFEDDKYFRARTINLPEGEKFVDFKKGDTHTFHFLITSDTLGNINIYSLGSKKLILEYQIKQQ